MKAKRTTAFFLSAAMLAGGLFALSARPAAAASNEDAWRTGTYLLGAGSLYALAKNKDTLAAAGGAGTYLGYRQWQNAKNQRQKNDRRRRYQRRVRNEYRYPRPPRYIRRADNYDPRFPGRYVVKDGYDSRYPGRYVNKGRNYDPRYPGRYEVKDRRNRNSPRSRR